MSDPRSQRRSGAARGPRFALSALTLVMATGLPGFVTPPAAAENFLWQPIVTVSRGGTESWEFRDLIRGRAGGFSLHAVLTRRVSRLSVRVFHTSVGADLDWRAAWDARREATFDNGDALVAFVPSAVVDSHDRVHLVHEAFDVFEEKTLHVGYKSSGWSHWNPETPPAFVPRIEAADCYGANPSIGLGKDAAGEEWLHVLYHRRPLEGTRTPGCLPFWYIHNAKALSAAHPDSGWLGETLFTDLFVDQGYRLSGEGGMTMAPVVDRRGRVHVVGRKKASDSDSVRVYHLAGMRPPTGRPWELRITALDAMPVAPDPETAEPRVWVTKQADIGFDGECEVLDAVWSRNAGRGTRARKELWFARCDLATDRWSAPIRIGPGGDRGAQGATLQRSRDGTLHVMYHDPAPQASDARIYYVRSTGDPALPGNWTGATPVTADVSSFAYIPVLLAEDDSVWVGFSSGAERPATAIEDEAPRETVTRDRRRTQASFRKGWRLGARTSGDQTWEGLVWLDADFVVAAGCEVVVRPGCIVLAADRSLSDEPGFTDGEVDLVVRGRLTVEGTDQAPIVFAAANASGVMDAAADWGGLHPREIAAGLAQGTVRGVLGDTGEVDSRSP